MDEIHRLLLQLKEQTDKQEKQIELLRSEVHEMKPIYDTITAINQEYMDKILKMTANKVKKKQFAQMRYDDLCVQVKGVIDIVLRRNNNKFENVMNDKNINQNQMTRHEIHYCVKRYFNSYENIHFASKLGIDLSLGKIGSITDRDHASVLHSCKVVEGQATVSKSYNNHIGLIIKECDRYVSKQINIIDNSNTT